MTDPQRRAQQVVDGMLAKDEFSRWLGVDVLQLRPDYCVCRMLVHTIVWQYMPRETRDRITAALAKAAAAATLETPIAHFAFEPDEIDGSGRMTLTVWPGGEPQILGRGHFHGRWARWA